MTRARWWLAASAAVLVTVMVVVVVGRETRSLRDVEPSQGPANLPIAFSLDRVVVPGWRLNASTLGLPADADLGRDPFSTSDGAAYFISDCSGTCRSASVYGIDVRTGKAIFQPVELTGAKFANCTRNGPSVAVCLDNWSNPGGLYAWVIDLEQGRVIHRGPTGLGWNSGTEHPWTQQASGGDGSAWTVATAKGEGIHGLGSATELTWFASGDGQLLNNNNASPLAVQLAHTKEPVYRVFSVTNGHELTPTAPAGTSLKRAVVYPGGFAYQFESGATVGVLFYDMSGRLLARKELTGYNLLDTGSLPVVLDRNVFRVFRPDGTQALAIPADLSSVPVFEVAGSSLYLWYWDDASSVDKRWQRWDLARGTAGKICTLNMTQYVGGNGNIVLTTDNADLTATDLSTCHAVWRWPATDYKVKQVGDGLIAYNQREVMSLRPTG